MPHRRGPEAAALAAQNRTPTELLAGPVLTGVGDQGWDAAFEAAGIRWIHRVIPAGRALLAQGTDPTCVYLLDRGLVKVVYYNGLGERFAVGVRSSGCLLGAAPALLGQVHPVSAETMTTCEVREVGFDEFRRAVISSPAVSWCTARVQCEDVYSHIQQLTAILTTSARNRIESFLLTLLREQHGQQLRPGAVIVLPLKHWELAQTIAITPEYLSRVLSQLEKDGVIRRAPGRLIITAPSRLRHDSDLSAMCESSTSPSTRRRGSGHVIPSSDRG